MVFFHSCKILKSTKEAVMAGEIILRYLETKDEKIFFALDKVFASMTFTS